METRNVREIWFAPFQIVGGHDEDNLYSIEIRLL